MNIVVIGAGIIGVTTAYRLKLKYPSVNVTVVAKDFSPNTTSDGAAGIWEPYIPGSKSEENLDRIREWSQETYNYLLHVLNVDDSTDHGIVRVHAVCVTEDEEFQPPFWSDIVYDFHLLKQQDLRRFPKSFKHGFGFTTVTVQSTKYIPWLSKKFLHLGGMFLRKEIKDLSKLGLTYDVIVNCTGAGGQQLMHDDKCYKIRGQLLRVRAPWVNEVLIAEYQDGRYCHISPAQNHVVLGGVVNEEKTTEEVCLEDKQWIIDSTQSLMPSLRRADQLYDWVGFRPARSKVRLEMEEFSIQHPNNGFKNVMIVHNYGHGGFGITTHWGNAGHAVNLVSQAIDKLKSQVKSKL